MQDTAVEATELLGEREHKLEELQQVNSRVLLPVVVISFADRISSLACRLHTLNASSQSCYPDRVCFLHM